MHNFYRSFEKYDFHAFKPFFKFAARIFRCRDIQCRSCDKVDSAKPKGYKMILFCEMKFFLLGENQINEKIVYNKKCLELVKEHVGIFSPSYANFTTTPT